MKQWEIWTWQFPGGDHPAVIVSAPDRVAHKPEINVLLCSSHRARRQAEPYEVILDEADGLDWATLCRCDILFVADRPELRHQRGLVSLERRRLIVRTILQCFDWLDLG